MTTFTHLFQSQLNLTVESQMCEEEREGGQWGFLGQFPDVNSPLPLPLSPYQFVCLMSYSPILSLMLAAPLKRMTDP